MLNKKLWKFILILGLCFSLQTLAFQLKIVCNNDTVTAKFSENNKTRIVVQGERIRALYGTPHALTTINDNRQGQVFILPTREFQKKPFSLFITTEKGKTYGLNLIPEDSLSATILLKPCKNNADKNLTLPKDRHSPIHSNHKQEQFSKSQCMQESNNNTDRKI